MSKKRLFSSLTAVAIVLIASYCPSLSVSSIIGNAHWRFALLPVMAPLLGALCGPLSLAGFAFLWLTCFPWSQVAEMALCRILLALHLPTIAATWYCSTVNMIRFVAPLSCILLFWMHPVGMEAWGYALYWFIPLAITLIPAPGFALTALGSSFTAHAVGSVLWLYAGLLTSPHVWIALIPVVWVERMGMTLCLIAGYTAWQVIVNKRSPFSATIWGLSFVTNNHHKTKEAA